MSAALQLDIGLDIPEPPPSAKVIPIRQPARPAPLGIVIALGIGRRKHFRKLIGGLVVIVHHSTAARLSADFDLQRFAQVGNYTAFIAWGRRS